MARPKAKNAPVIEGTGGLRKLRCGRKDKGKSAGYRVCYVYFEEFATVLLVTIYGKNEQDDISAAERKAIRRLIETIEADLSSRTYRAGSAPDGEEEE